MHFFFPVYFSSPSFFYASYIIINLIKVCLVKRLLLKRELSWGARAGAAVDEPISDLHGPTPVQLLIPDKMAQERDGCLID
jgi:hypothetical protein